MQRFRHGSDLRLDAEIDGTDIDAPGQAVKNSSGGRAVARDGAGD